MNLLNMMIMMEEMKIHGRKKTFVRKIKSLIIYFLYIVLNVLKLRVVHLQLQERPSHLIVNIELVLFNQHNLPFLYF